MPINDMFDTAKAPLAELYVNDFNKLGRTFRVQLQSNRLPLAPGGYPQYRCARKAAR